MNTVLLCTPTCLLFPQVLFIIIIIAIRHDPQREAGRMLVSRATHHLSNSSPLGLPQPTWSTALLQLQPATPLRRFCTSFLCKTSFRKVQLHTLPSSCRGRSFDRAQCVGSRRQVKFSTPASFILFSYPCRVPPVQFCGWFTGGN